MVGFVVESFTPIAKNSLVGFATVRAPSGLIFVDVAVHRKGDAVSASPASNSMLDRNCTQMRDTAGKLRWTPIVSFSDRQVRDRWSNGAIEALLAANLIPGAGDPS